jgi:hypothetical protein
MKKMGIRMGRQSCDDERWQNKTCKKQEVKTEVKKV